jgi:hypothetical protein
MTLYTRLAAAAAAVIVIGIVGYNLLPRSSAPAGLSAATPTVSPAIATPSAPPILILHEGSLTPGRYRLRPLSNISPMTIDINVPEGWSGFPDWAVLGPVGTDAPAGTGVGFLSAEGLFSDPCHWDAKGDGTLPQEGDVAVGPSAAELADALVANGSYTASRPSDTTVDGYPAKRLDLRLPGGIDLQGCDNGAGSDKGAYFVWGTRHAGGSDLFAQGPSNLWHLWIVDVNGDRLVIVITDYDGTPSPDQAAARAIVASVTIEP